MAYNPKLHPLQVRDVAAMGFDDQKMAAHLGISNRTFYNWQKKHEEFRAAVLQGKELYDTGQVEAALLNRALGYTSVERSFKLNNEGELVEISRKEKHVPADTTAMIFWLKNRSHRWVDVNRTEVANAPGETIGVRLELDPELKGLLNAIYQRPTSS